MKFSIHSHSVLVLSIVAVVVMQYEHENVISLNIYATRHLSQMLATHTPNNNNAGYW
jgi:hypothetical protein